MSQLSPAGRLAAMLLLLAAASALAAVSGQPSPYDVKIPVCQNDIDALWRTCKQCVQKEGPKVPTSKDCCTTIKAADAHATCICDYLGSADAKEKLSLEKVFYVTNQCGVTVPAGCGSNQV
ncbi:hypothetical protein BS78_01G256000 [Paspalum vaginatum]|nr:hypothetical protein BS78_01G256000 [Paspalum vaginatum]